MLTILKCVIITYIITHEGNAAFTYESLPDQDCPSKATDIKKILNISHADCKTECDNNNTCVAVVLHKNADPTYCYLKSKCLDKNIITSPGKLVYRKECFHGTYGSYRAPPPYCSGICSGNCKNEQPCNHNTGVCDQGCTAGYNYNTDNKCSTACSDGTWGDNCNGQCSHNCINKDLCQKSDGQCINGCKLGYDYMRNQSCEIVCPAHTYGYNCTTCPVTCNNSCESRSIEAQCIDGCVPGYQGMDCLTVCDNGTYGTNCSQICDPCPDNRVCDHITGVCPMSVPVTGSSGGEMTASSGGGMPIGAVIGGLLVGVLIICVVVVIVFAVLRRRKREGKKETGLSFSEANLVDNTDKAASPKPFLVITDDSPKSGKKNKKGDDYINFAVESPTCVKVSDLGKYIIERQKESEPFQNEFKTIPKTATDSQDYSGQGELKHKNRLKNILPYDKNRVILSVQNDDLLTDYINASHIQDYDGKNAYIASHGPSDATVTDFWRMIWEHKVQQIVMVTNLVESGKVKCFQYWPNTGTVDHQGIAVSAEETEVYLEYKIRHFTLSKGDDKRKVLQYHYIGWPDHGVPLYVTGILSVWEKIKSKNIKGEPPIVVHCCAGVGRTGTFIAINNLLTEAARHGSIDVFNCVNKLRHQRISMVQSRDQYIFIHRAIWETTEVGKTAITDLREFDATLCELEQKTGKKKSQMEVQFEYLEHIRPMITDVEKESALQNMNKNRDKTVLPADKHLLIVPSHSNFYINAVYVPAYRKKRGCIVTQIPLENTIDDFWIVVREYQIETIVLLENSQENEKWYKNGFKWEGDYEFEMKFCTEQIEEDIKIVDLELEFDHKQDGKLQTRKMAVKLFYPSSWASKPVSERSATELVNLQAKADMWYKQSKHQSMLVMCRNGCNESGLYLAYNYLQGMASSELEADVLNVVKQIRTTRPKFIQSLAEYRYLHTAVKGYITAFGEYSNFS